MWAYRARLIAQPCSKIGGKERIRRRNYGGPSFGFLLGYRPGQALTTNLKFCLTYSITVYWARYLVFGVCKGKLKRSGQSTTYGLLLRTPLPSNVPAAELTRYKHGILCTLVQIICIRHPLHPLSIASQWAGAFYQPIRPILVNDEI